MPSGSRGRSRWCTSWLAAAIIGDLVRWRSTSPSRKSRGPPKPTGSAPMRSREVLPIAHTVRHVGLTLITVTTNLLAARAAGHRQTTEPHSTTSIRQDTAPAHSQIYQSSPGKFAGVERSYRGYDVWPHRTSASDPQSSWTKVQ
jgi:hypothetical protein